MVHLLGLDLGSIWNADTTTNRDRKRLLRCLIEEVQLSTKEDHFTVRVVWKGGATTERKRVREPAGWARRTPEDTVALVSYSRREILTRENNLINYVY